MNPIGADELLAAFDPKDPGHHRIMQRLDARTALDGACTIALAEVVEFLRRVTTPPKNAPSIDAVNFVHWLVNERGVRLEVPFTEVPSMDEQALLLPERYAAGKTSS